MVGDWVDNDPPPISKQLEERTGIAPNTHKKMMNVGGYGLPIIGVHSAQVVYMYQNGSSHLIYMQ